MSSSTSNNNNQNINPRSCVYGCGIQIYWNASVNEYWEVLTKKRHICPNIVSNKNKTSITPPSNAPKPYYYNSTKKASFSSANPKPKMSNSFELLTGPIDTIQKSMKSYLILFQSKMVRSMVLNPISLQIICMKLIVYYEVPLGQREEVKRKFENFVRNNQLALQRN